MENCFCTSRYVKVNDNCISCPSNCDACKYNDKDGNVFDGEFKNGKKEGQGMLIKKTGEKVEGIFSNDELVK